MSTFDELSLDEVEAAMAQLRDRRRTLKKSGKANARKIDTLLRRRERIMERVRQLDAQVEALRSQMAAEPVPAPRRRGRRPKSEQVASI